MEYRCFEKKIYYQSNIKVSLNKTVERNNVEDEWKVRQTKITHTPTETVSQKCLLTERKIYDENRREAMKVLSRKHIKDTNVK